MLATGTLQMQLSRFLALFSLRILTGGANIYIKTTEIGMQKWSITTDFLWLPRHTHTAGPPLLVTIRASKLVEGFPKFAGLMIWKVLIPALTFCSLTSTRDGTAPNQTTHCALNFVAQAHACTGTHKEQWRERAE